MIFHEMSPRTHYSGLEIKEKMEVSFLRRVKKSYIVANSQNLVAATQLHVEG